VVVRKNITREKGERRLFDEIRYLFYTIADGKPASTISLIGHTATSRICIGSHTTMTAIVLTARQRKQVELRRKTTLDRRIYERLTAVLTVAAGRTPEDVTNLLGIDPSQLSAWLRLFRSEGLEALCTLVDGEPPPANA
jgi:hypothetical protein